ncbi:MAG: MFS transporter, partial [Nocardioides sp.]
MSPPISIARAGTGGNDVPPTARSAATRLAVSLDLVGPTRRLALGTLCTSIAGGAYAAGSVVSFIRYETYSTTAIGLMLSIGAFGALATTLPVGYLCDRLGARRVTSAANCLQAIGALAVLVAPNLATFGSALLGYAAAERAGNVGRTALVA